MINKNPGWKVISKEELIPERETAGKISSDLLLKSINDTHNAVDQTRENLTDYEKKLIECLEYHKQNVNGNFFIEITVKKEKLMQNVIRNIFVGRLSCPTPNYDQILYRYSKNDDRLDFLWVIPSRDTCIDMMRNFLNIHPEEQELYHFVRDFENGTLMKIAKKFNKEEDDSDLIIQ
jgi:hypothetical protein